MLVKLLRLESCYMQQQLLLAKSITGNTWWYPQSHGICPLSPCTSPNTCPLGKQAQSQDNVLPTRPRLRGSYGTKCSVLGQVPHARQCLSPYAWARVGPPGPQSRQHGLGQLSAGQQWALQHQRPAQGRCSVWQLGWRFDREAAQGLFKQASLLPAAQQERLYP